MRHKRALSLRSGGTAKAPVAHSGIESFEETDLSAWDTSGGTWEQKTDHAYDGSKSLAGEAGNFGGVGSHIWDWVYKGSVTAPATIKGRFYYAISGANINYGLVLMADAANAYLLSYDIKNNSLSLFKAAGNVVGTHIGQASPTSRPSLNAWFEMGLSVDADNIITGKIYDSGGTLLATVTATDAGYTSGGYGVVVAQGENGDASARVDYLEWSQN